jgi:hypothetical protein
MPTPTPVLIGTVANTSDILINEIMYNPEATPDANHEWIELFNATNNSVRLIGWTVNDQYDNDPIPSLNISPNGFAVIAASMNFSECFPAFNGTVIYVNDGRIGNSLGNSGDRLTLNDSAGNTIDEISYGSGFSMNSSSCPKVSEGHSMERSPAGGSFVDNSEPTPGFGLVPPVPTPTPKQSLQPTPTASITPEIQGTVANRSDIVINEILYNPPQSGSESAYEWLELYNTLDQAVLLSGWRISDNYSSDAISCVNISPKGFMLVAASPDFYENYSDYTGTIVFIEDGRIGNGLGNSGDCLILRDAEDNVIDALSYGDDDSITSSPFKKVAGGHSMERCPADGSFTDNLDPTPGFGLNDSEPVLEESPAAKNESAGTVVETGAVLINEVHNNPVQTGSDTSYEWIELYNMGNESVTLAGWLVCDNRGEDIVPDIDMPAKGLAIVAASQNFSVNFPDYDGIIVFIEDGRIGSGLGNGGDCLMLKDSTGNVIDEMSYGDDDSITSPPWPEVADGRSLERRPCGGSFVDSESPTPGNCLPEAIVHNESVDVIPVSPVSNESDSGLKHHQSENASLSAIGKAHTSSSQEKSAEFPGVSLSALIATLSLSIISTLGWMLYRRKAG